MRMPKLFILFIILLSSVSFVLALDPTSHDPSEISPNGKFAIGNYTFVDSLQIYNTVNATTFCIGNSCISSWSPFLYNDIAINNTIQSLSVSNTTTWLMAMSLNSTQNLISLGGALNVSLSQYLSLTQAQDMSASNTTTWNMAQSINTTANIESLNIEVPWTQLKSYPSACPAGSYVNTLGDTLTCVPALSNYNNIALLNQTNTFLEDAFFNKNIYISGELVSVGSSSINGSILVSKDNIFTIGNTTDAFQNLYVYNLGRNTTASDSFTVTNILKSSNNLYVNSSSVGIGTDTPSQKLEVAGGLYLNGGALSAPLVLSDSNYIYGGGSTASANVIFGTNSGQTEIYGRNNNINFYSAGGGASYMLIKSGLVGIGTIAPSHQLTVTGTTGVNITNTGAGSSLLVNDEAGDTTPFVINAGGNVGIGNITPSRNLDVYQVGATGYIRISGYGSSDRSNIGILEFYNTESHTGNITASINSKRGIGNYQAGQLGFFTSAPTTGVLNERMTIDENGNIGIGTNTPSHTLTVAGNTNITGLLGLGDITPTSRLMVNGDINASGDVKGGRLCIGTDCQSTWGSVGSGGSSPWISTGATVMLNNTFTAMNVSNNLYVNATNVGIGIATPIYPLSLNGRFEGYYGTTQAFSFTPTSTGAVMNVRDSSGTSVISLDARPGTTVYFNTGTNVGIGTTSPGSKLSVWNGAFNVSDASNTFFFVNNNTGKVGIMDSAPTSTLSVTGNINASGDVKGNRICIGTDCQSTWGSVGSGGSSPWISTGATVMLNNTFTAMNVSNNLYVNATNVGIGTASPADKLDVAGAILTSAPLAFHQTSRGVFEYSGGKVAIRAYGATAGTGYIAFNVGGGGGSTDSEKVRIDKSGNVGIGTSAPAATLTVVGNTNFTTSTDSTTAFQFLNKSGDSVFDVDTTNMRVGIGTTGAGYVPLYPLDVVQTTGEIARFGGGGLSDQAYIGIGGNRALFGYSGASNTVVQSIESKGIQFNVNNNTFGYGTAMVISSTGMVGIGDTAPTSALSVTGNINASGGMSATQFCIGASCTTSWASNPYNDISINATIYTIAQSNTTTWDMAKSINTTNNFIIGHGLTLNSSLSQYLDLTRAQTMSTSNTTTWNMAKSINITNNMLALGLALNSTFVQYGLNSTFAQYDAFNRNWTTLSLNLFALNSSLSQVPLNSTFLQYLPILNAPITSPLTYTGTEVRLNNTFVSMNISNSLIINSTSVRVNNNANLTIAQDVLIGSTNNKGRIHWNGSCQELYGGAGVWHIC